MSKLTPKDLDYLFGLICARTYELEARLEYKESVFATEYKEELSKAKELQTKVFEEMNKK